MDKFIRMVKKYWWLLAFVVLVIIPLMMNFLFKSPAPVEWMEYEEKAGDMLVYYSSILTMMGSIFLGIVAYEQNKRLLKLESDSKKVILKVCEEKSSVEINGDNFVLKLVFENFNKIPIGNIKIHPSNRKLMPAKFEENDPESKYVFITGVAPDIRPESSYEDFNTFEFDLSKYKGKFKVLSFETECDSMFDEKSRQVFNVLVVHKKVSDYMTRQIL